MQEFYDKIATYIKNEWINKFQPLEYLKKFFQKAMDFNGRANRLEFWCPAVMLAVVSFVFNILYALLTRLGIGFLAQLIDIIHLLWTLLILIPAISSAVRRLHDINMTGWLVLVGLIPFIGWIALLVLLALNPVNSGNKYS